MAIPVCCSSNPFVRPCEPALEGEWDKYVYAHSRGSLFHLTAWKRVVERAFGFEPRYLAAVENDKICGVLPLFIVNNIVQGRSLISVPFAVYGGICADDDQTGDCLRAAACAMAQEEAAQYLELREEWPTSYPDFHTKHLYVGFAKNLPADAEELLRGFPRDTRYMIRKGGKQGLVSVLDNRQLDVFYDIYAHSVRQLGTPVFSKRYFQILLEEFAGKCEVTAVWHGKRAVAGVLSFRFRESILPYYGGSLAEGRALAANNFMYWEVMRRALDAGVKHFDFGRSKIGTGAYVFKSQWNMEERSLPYQFYLVRRKSMPNFSPANPRFRLGIALWRRMPFPLTKVLGPPLVRLFP